MDPACADDPDSDAWFSTPAEPKRRRHALTICASCPLGEPCLELAYATGQEHGIWGGVTAEDRQARVVGGAA